MFRFYEKYKKLKEIKLKYQAQLGKQFQRPIDRCQAAAGMNFMYRHVYLLGAEMFVCPAQNVKNRLTS